MKKFWKRKKTVRDAAPWEWVRWCRIALDQVEFFPDRRGIELELLNHMEDSREGWIRRGYEPKEAAAKALEAMGDAREVGRALNKAHHPLWGWLWQATRGLVLLIALFGLFLFGRDVCDNGGIRESVPVARTIRQLQTSAPPENAVKVKAGDYTVWYDPVLTLLTAEEAYTLYSQSDREIAVAGPGEWYMAELRYWVEGPLLAGEPRWTALLEPWDQTGPLSEESLYQASVGTGYYASNWGGWTRHAFTYRIGLLHEPAFLALNYPYGHTGLTMRAEPGEGGNP